MKKHDSETKVAVGFLPQDISVAGAGEGDWVSLALYDSLTAVYMSDVGTASQDSTVKLQQSTTAAGAGPVKDLDAGQWFVAQNTTVGDIGDELTADGTAGEFEDDGESACVARVEVTGDQLDTANDYAYVRVHASDPGTSTGKIASVVMILRSPRYAQAVPEQPTVLA